MIFMVEMPNLMDHINKDFPLRMRLRKFPCFLRGFRYIPNVLKKEKKKNPIKFYLTTKNIHKICLIYLKNYIEKEFFSSCSNPLNTIYNPVRPSSWGYKDITVM